MTSWTELPLAAFDLETTGPNPTKDRIVTADTLWFNPIDGTVAAHKSYLADPGVEIPAAATEVHRVTTAYARTHGQPVADVVLLVLDDLEAAWARGLPVVAFNAPFDFTTIDRELRRHHNRELKISGPVLDPYVIDYGVDSERAGSRSLAAVCTHHGVLFKDAHTSAGDAEATGRLMASLLRQHPAKLTRRSVGDLWRSQRAWYRALAEKRSNRTGQTVNTEWPIKPYAPTEVAA